MAPTFPNSSGTTANFVSFSTNMPTTKEQIVGRLLQEGHITSEEAITLLQSPFSYTTGTSTFTIGGEAK